MNYTLITGASRGIGESMARYCAGKNHNLILIARSTERLQALAQSLKKPGGGDILIFTADITESEATKKIYEWCCEKDLQVNILINNVGIGLYGKFEDLSLKAQMDLIQLNQIAMVTMTYHFLPMLKEQKKAHILNVASTACYQPIPYMSVYAATQSFIQSFSLAVREEFKKMKIYVSCLCPGPTSTDFFERAGLESLPVNSNEIKMSSEEVAEVAVEGMLDNVAEIIPGASNTIGAYFSKLFPNTLVLRAVANLFSPKS